VWKQYGDYLRAIVTRFDFGPSFKRGVTRTKSSRASCRVGAVGTAGVHRRVQRGLLLGAISAVRHNSWIDRVCMFFAVFGVSTPSYVFITVLIVTLAATAPGADRRLGRSRIRGSSFR
jgi:oligopeptide transport system permease protein